MKTLSNTRTTLIGLAAISLLAVIVILITPPEATLGSNIRLVFVHGALIMTGMFGFYAAGVLGLLTALTANETLFAWCKTVAWVGFAMFTAGVAMSTIASSVIWGGVPLQEPRMLAALNNIALAVIILTLFALLPQVRLKGAIAALFAAYLAWTTYTAELVLHPANPIGTSTSSGIQTSFAALLGLCIIASGLLIWRFRHSTA